MGLTDSRHCSENKQQDLLHGTGSYEDLPSGEGSSCQCRRHGFPWRSKWQPTPVFLPRKFHGQRSLASYSHGVAESWTPLSDWAHTHGSCIWYSVITYHGKECEDVPLEKSLLTVLEFNVHFIDLISYPSHFSFPSLSQRSLPYAEVWFIPTLCNMTFAHFIAWTLLPQKSLEFDTILSYCFLFNLNR